MVDDTERRIRQKAHDLWVAEGRPEGRHEFHWAEAREIVALEDAGGSPTVPLEETLGDDAEPAIAVENQGEFPGLRDQGDAPAGPSHAAAADTAGAGPQTTGARPRRSGKEAAPAAKPAKAEKPAAAKAAGKSAAEKPKGGKGRKNGASADA